MSTLTDLLARIDQLKNELDKMRPLDRELEERILQKFRLWWTYHSNAIEGNKLTQGETEMFLMEGLTAKGKPLKDHMDLRGHSNAVNYLLAFVRGSEQPLTEAEVRKLHEVLLVEAYQVPAITPDGLPVEKTIALGEYKKEPNHVRTPTGEVHYYATPLETPAKMQELVAWQREEFAKHRLHPVEIAARFHHQFTEIHPFDDGNGRMARLLMNLLLMQNGYPPVVIRLQERDDYLLALRQADSGQKEEFLSFISEKVADSLALYLRAANGEEIHEPTDIEKEIALLKLELKHIEEPQPLTQELQKQLFEKSLDPLFLEIKRLIFPLCDFFTDSRVRISGFFGYDQIEGVIEDTLHKIQTINHFPRPSRIWEAANIARSIIATFELIGFKRSRLDTFDTSLKIVFNFEPLKYGMALISLTPPYGIQHFYQEQLTTVEITTIAQQVARFFLEVIKEKTEA